MLSRWAVRTSVWKSTKGCLLTKYWILSAIKGKRNIKISILKPLTFNTLIFFLDKPKCFTEINRTEKWTKFRLKRNSYYPKKSVQRHSWARQQNKWSGFTENQTACCSRPNTCAQPRTSATRRMSAQRNAKVGLCGSYRLRREKWRSNQYGSSGLTPSLGYEIFVPSLKLSCQHLLSLQQKK